MKNALLLLFSILVALALGEVMLRTFTVFPISEESSKIDDKRLGYRLSPGLADVDGAGFRNSAGKASNFIVAAFGDSHTYGSTVTSPESWPAQFEQMTGQPTYNFGIGSYNVYTYHALFGQVIESRAKAIIVGLYVANDFDYRFYHCTVPDGDFEYWKAEATSLQLKVPTTEKECIDNNKRKQDFGIDSLDEYVAVVSAFLHLVQRPLEERIAAFNPVNNFEDPNYYFQMPGSVQPQSIKLVRRHGRETDLERPETRQVFDDFQKMVNHWSREAKANNIALGFLIITSRARNAYAYLEKAGILNKAPDEFRNLVQKQIEMEKQVFAVLERYGVDYEVVTADVVESLSKEAIGGERVYPRRGGHPGVIGYRAYAIAAERLWTRIKP